MAAYLNRIGAAVPANDVHDAFVRYADTLLTDERSRRLFRRMAERSQIEHRWSTLQPAPPGANSGIDSARRATRPTPRPWPCAPPRAWPSAPGSARTSPT